VQVVTEKASHYRSSSQRYGLLFGHFGMRADVEHIDDALLRVHSPPDSIAPREVILVDTSQRADQGLGLAWDRLSRGKAQMSVDELTGFSALSRG